MVVKNLTYHTDFVSWIHEGRKITKRLSDIYYASDGPTGVYAECGKNFTQTAIYEFSEEGKILFAHDRILGKVTWQHNERYINIKNEALTQVNAFFNHKIILAIDKVNEKLIGISLNGPILFQAPPPSGYSFYRLSETEGLPSVVCEGGEYEDKYGRIQWHFVVDTATGALIRRTFAY